MLATRDIEISPATAGALAALDDVKAALSITGGAQDDELNALISEASDTIERYCASIFVTRDVTERHLIDEPVTSLLMFYAPAKALTSVAVDDAAQSVDDYRLNLMTAILRRVDHTCFAPGETVVVYAAGYADADVPPAVKRAALELCQYLYNSKGKDDDLSSSLTFDVGQEQYRRVVDRTMQANGVSLPTRVALMLAPYKRNFVA